MPAPALDGLASGMRLDSILAMGATLTLRTYAALQRDMDLLDAAAGLETLTTRENLSLDHAGCHRAAVLAAREVESLESGKTLGR